MKKLVMFSFFCWTAQGMLAAHKEGDRHEEKVNECEQESFQVRKDKILERYRPQMEQADDPFVLFLLSLRARKEINLADKGNWSTGPGEKYY